MNNISFILFIFSLLVVSSLSADTDDSNPKENAVASDKEVRDAVVRALLDQENQTNKTLLERLSEDTTSITPSPSPYQKKSDVSSQTLMKVKQKDQDTQRTKIQGIVATANKQLKKQENNKDLLLLTSMLINKKSPSDSSNVISIAENKKEVMTRVVIAENDTLKTPKKSPPETLDSKQVSLPQDSKNNPNIKIGEIENMPVGRNQLGTEEVGKQNLAEKNTIDVLDIKQVLVSQLSKNTPLDAVDSTVEGRNEPVVKRVQGWIYLGRFESGIWENETLKVEKQLPQAGKQYVVKATSLYVRNALPKKGKMGKIIHAFRTDDKIKVLNLKGLGRNRDFYWAEILRE